MELSGKTIGVVGYGHTGSATARIARGFGMKVLAYTSKSQEKLPEGVTKATIDEVFTQSDIVSLHCPLTSDTHHLVDAARLSQMKSTSILINTGRGPLVDEPALAQALNAGSIAAAGLDVLSVEPPSADNPLLFAPNCYITPHIAWATLEARTRLMDIAVENLRDFIVGRVSNAVV
jgi:glycerate dehydrogenase